MHARELEYKLVELVRTINGASILTVALRVVLSSKRICKLLYFPSFPNYILMLVIWLMKPYNYSCLLIFFALGMR